MERSDTRRLPVPVLNERRRRAVVLRLKGLLRWMTLAQAINASLLIEFLRRLVRDADGKVFLILENLQAHKAPAVMQWLAGHRDRIEVFYLPSYSPELYPNELLNADLKQAIRKQAPKRHKGELKQAVRRQLRKLARWPERVKQYFRAPDVAYSA